MKEYVYNSTAFEYLSYSWDQKNRLVGVLNAPGGDVTYTYDAFGRRVTKAIDGTTTRKYLYDGGDIVEEQDGSDNLVARYIRTMNIDEPLARVDSSGDEVYYLRDILGSVIALVNSSGDVVTRYNYSPFGDTDVIGVDVDQPFRFTGREWDAETGMYSYRLRTYAPDMGRFISEDPLRFGAGDVNFYRYVGNNPANFIDPMGLDLKGTQVRNSDGTTTMYFYDTDTGMEYIFNNLLENAPVKSPYSGVDFGDSAKLPPGSYNIDESTDKNLEVCKPGYPLYTKSGEPKGFFETQLTRLSDIRQRESACMHVGSQSAGCVIFPSNETGKKSFQSMLMLMKYYWNLGPVTIEVK